MNTAVKVNPSKLDDAVILTSYEPGAGFPTFVQPREGALREDRAAFAAWFHNHREALDQLLAEVGSLVFRGFPIRDTDSFGNLISHYDSPKFGYTAGSSPRRQLAPRVFESTYTPAQDVIMLHQEMAYLPVYPTKVAFFCRVPAVSGGETSIADMRRVTAALAPDFVAAVEARGVQYKRNFRDRAASTGDAYLDAIHRTWQDAFNTTDKSKPVADCAAMGLEAEWLADGSLSTIFRSPGMITHPRTGERIWFNQISTTTICPDSVGQARYDLQDAYYGKTKPKPYETTYNDGGRIAWEHISALYTALRTYMVRFPWSHGDILLVDNYVTAHGRNSYTGLRDVQVALLA